MNLKPCPANVLDKKRRRGLHQTLLTMRLIILLTVLTCFKVTAAVYAQNISLKLKDQPIEKAFDEIKKQSGYQFFYNDRMLENTIKVSVSLKNARLTTALDECFKNQPITYEVVGKSIVVKIRPHAKNKKPEAPVQVNVKITGKVVDEKGNRLSRVTIKIKGTDRETVTDDNGNFSIDVPDEKAVLEISIIGYETAVFAINGSNSSPTIILKEAVNQLNELTVINTGYQSLPKERATGSFSSVNNELFNRQISTDVISRLKSIAPSLLFDERTGTTKLNIRGRSTIFANDQPLIVVDNFPFDGDINSLNPNDVENITILRDAAAASIWGVRAGNGVIVITTKRGRLNTSPTIALHTNVTIGKKPDLFYRPAMSSAEFIDLETFLFNNGQYEAAYNDPTMPPLTPVIELLYKAKNGTITNAAANELIDNFRSTDLRNDLQDHMYKQSLNQQYALNVSGGEKTYAYYFSAGWDKNRGAATGNNLSRSTLNFSNTFKPIKGLEMGLNLTHSQSKTLYNNILSQIVMSGTKAIYPYASLIDNNGTSLAIVKDYRSNFTKQAASQGYLNWNYRPLDELSASDNQNKAYNTRVNANVGYQIIPGLKAEIRYQFEDQIFHSRELNGVDSYYTRDLINSLTTATGSILTRNVPLGAILRSGTDELNSNNGRAQLNFAKEWADHDLTALAGFEARETKSNGSGGIYYGFEASTGAFANVNFSEAYLNYPKGSGIQIPGPSDISRTVDRFRSYFANAAYTFKQRYTISASARKDESNLFGVKTNQKGTPLWSVGAAWNPLKESLVNLPLGLLKLRATLGYNGNFDNTATAFTTARYSGNYVFTQQPYAALVTPPNAELRWEKIKTVNIGVDFSTRGGRLSGSLDYYSKKGQDLLGLSSLNLTTGFSSYKGNVASSSGSGIDFELNSLNIRSALTWETSLFFSHVSDKITKYDIAPSINNIFIDGSGILSDAYSYSPIVGRPLFSIYSYKWAGLSSDNGSPKGLLNGQPSTDHTSLLKLPVDSLVFNGRATPSFYGAIRNTIKYKSLSFSINVGYKIGYYFRRTSVSYSDLVSFNRTHSDYSLRWQKPGDETTTDVPSFIYPNNSSRDLFYARSNALVEKGDHIRLQDLQVNYSFTQAVFTKLPLNAINVFTYVNNIGILWRANKHNIDPDYGTQIPAPRTIAFGVKMDF